MPPPALVERWVSGERRDGRPQITHAVDSKAKQVLSEENRNLTSPTEREAALPEVAIGNLGDASCRAALDALQGYLLIASPDRTIRFMSRAPQDSTTRSFIGRNLLDIFADEHRQPLLQATESLLARGAPAELEVRGKRSGRWYAMRIAGIEEHGGITGLSIHCLDVDDAKRKETETALLRSRLHAQRRAARGAIRGHETEEIQRRFDLMADALPVLISYVDRHRRYQYNNAAYERWFSASREELRGRKLPDVLGAEAYEHIRPYVDAALQGRSVTFELRIPYQGAGPRQVVAHYVPDISSRGRVLGFYALIEDVSGQREAEAAVRLRDEELRQLQKMEALGRLASGMAHEFNNLLHVVIVGCRAALPMLSGSPAALPIAQIERAAERGASLTRQLLSFSRSGKTNTTPLDLDALVTDICILLDSLLGSHIELVVSVGARCRVLADGGQIQQILMNLAINARDAMPKGGQLNITTSHIDIGARDPARPTLVPGPYALITITDTGSGMDEQTLERIFDPFFTTKAPECGTGLGLFTVYGIMTQLRGYIETESAVTRGTTFHLYLPALALQDETG